MNLTDNSTINEVKKSYRKLVFLYHPDTGKEPNSTKFIELTEIYKELSDPITKNTYDLRLKTFKLIEKRKFEESHRNKKEFDRKEEVNWQDIYKNSKENSWDTDDLIIGGVAIVFSAIVLNRVFKKS